MIVYHRMRRLEHLQCHDLQVALLKAPDDLADEPFPDAVRLYHHVRHFFFRGKDPVGEFIESFEGGRNAWLTRDDIAKLPDLFPDVAEGLDIIDGKEFRLIERKYEVEKY